MKQEIKAQEGNIQIQKITHKENFVILSTYHLLDNRLTIGEKGFLTMLLCLPKNWKLTKRGTSKYFNMSVNTFKTYIKKMIDYGYVEIIKLKQNKEIYKIKEICDIHDKFNIYNLKSYSIAQLKYFSANGLLSVRDSKIVLSYLKHLTEFEKEYKKELAYRDNEKF